MSTRRKKTDRTRNGAVDEAGAETFPASDPPAYAGGGVGIGAPARPAQMRTKPKRAGVATGRTAKRKRK